MINRVSSFTSIVKEEIISKPFEDERIKSLLASFLKANGRYYISNKESRIELQSEHAKIAQYLYTQLKRIYQINGRFAYSQTKRFAKKMTYHVIIEEKVDHILHDLNISFLQPLSLKDFLKNDDQIAGYIDGIFLALGSVNHPESSNYHLEMASEDDHLMNELLRLLKRYKPSRFEFKTIKRRYQTVLYLKKSDQIADFLIFLGATDATLEYESIRVSRDYINSDNRWQNCETANMEKTIMTAQQQIKDINFLDELVGIDNIANEKAIALAHLRLEDESASYSELANRLQEQINKPVSKSNVAHLFRYIKQLANRYRHGQ